MIIGGYGFGNIGDEAILLCLLKKIKYLYDEITVFSRNPSETISLHKVHAEKKNIKRFLSCDDIIIGGGELFQDGLAWKNAIAIILAKLLRKKVKVLGVGIDVNGKVEKLLTQLSLRITDEISVRDNRSVNNLVSMGINSDKIKLVKDFAFCLEPQLTERINAFFLNHKLRDSKLIVLVLRQKTSEIDNMLFTFFTEFVSNLLQERRNLKILLMPFSRHPDSAKDNDMILLQKLKSKVENDNLIIFEGTFEPPTILWLISKAALVISARLHPLIFSKIVNTKAIAIPISPKIMSYAEEYNCPTAELKNLEELYKIIEILDLNPASKNKQINSSESERP